MNESTVVKKCHYQRRWLNFELEIPTCGHPKCQTVSIFMFQMVYYRLVQMPTCRLCIYSCFRWSFIDRYICLVVEVLSAQTGYIFMFEMVYYRLVQIPTCTCRGPEYQTVYIFMFQMVFYRLVYMPSCRGPECQTGYIFMFEMGYNKLVQMPTFRGCECQTVYRVLKSLKTSFKSTQTA